MRGALILLALLGLGIGGDSYAPQIPAGTTTALAGSTTGPAETAPAQTASAQTAPVLEAGDPAGATAFVRSAAGLVAVSWVEGTGPSSGPLVRRPGDRQNTGLPSIIEPASASFRARSDVARTFSAGALIRAGSLSFSTATPPPFQAV